MAIRPFTDSGLGYVSTPTESSPFEGKDPKEQLPQLIASFRNLWSTVRSLIIAFNGHISLGNGNQSSRAGNLDAQYIEFIFADADTRYQIPHSLNRVPSGYIVIRKSAPCIVYDDAESGGWSITDMYLKCDTGSVTVKLLVF